MKDKVITYLDVYNSDCINPTNNINPVNIPNHVNNINNSNNVNAQLNDTTVPANSNEVPLDPSNSTDPKQPVKKGRKVKSNKSQWRKEKGNKYLNKPYRNYKGVEIKSKEFVDYDCKCQMKCREILSAAERKQEFQKFWELGSYEAQAIFLIARVDEQVTKKSTKKKKDKKDENEESEKVDTPEGKKSKRQFSRTYILKSKQVCRNMFVKTLGITSKRINTALVKMRSKSLIDHRGLSQGGKNKISDKRYDEVVDHIKKMPRYKCSHLQGKFDSEFLPPELSLSKMYDLYSKEVDQPVSLSMYKKIYYGKFNFKTKGIKKEICNICKGERKIKNENLKKQQQNREKHQYPCPSPPNDQVVLQHHQYRPTNNFMPPPPINCNQSWLPPPNFQMPQHNPAHYFEQPMGYE
ncbi:DUF3824 domain-containing protein [Nephila pilipes]|uniref:DUF3824 domain-containing protein n=1 Tax=Nephila pilipes TaxID=299642 RepID=A0A8X6NZ22_NEPPI|nr:DUF3824 domain-containing protein [Nephila pilipes]